MTDLIRIYELKPLQSWKSPEKVKKFESENFGYYKLPMINRMAVTVLITGQILKGISLVRASVNKLKIERINRKAADEK
jgi:hypothetical protein